MKNKIRIALGLMLTSSLSVAAVPSDATTLVPSGWKVISHAIGDLNQDGLADIALIIQEDNIDKVLIDIATGEDVVNINPRRVIVALQQNVREPKRYRVVVDNARFILPKSDQDRPCLLDPLAETENNGLKIEKGVLKTSIQFMYSCGSQYMTQYGFTFRWQQRRMALIGLEFYQFHRITSHQKSVSINYSTQRIISRDTRLDTKNARQISMIKHDNLRINPKYTLDQMQSNESFLSKLIPKIEND
ncbi:hypothetical protein [Acinetobacter sp. c3-l95]|uniref:hypothetical protein n=1 Tax=Acinetobacter sp. c3-l95 TaxID=3342804 RepID=UPI0035B74365